MSFNELVTQNFNFMESEYDFQTLEKGIGYVKNDLELEFHQGNGQVDITFFVRKSDEIFKPFISRSFDINSVLMKISQGKLEDYPKEINGYLTDLERVDVYLSYYSRMLKQHGENILKGDLSIFEDIHLKRRDMQKDGKK